MAFEDQSASAHGSLGHRGPKANALSLFKVAGGCLLFPHPLALPRWDTPSHLYFLFNSPTEFGLLSPFPLFSSFFLLLLLLFPLLSLRNKMMCVSSSSPWRRILSKRSFCRAACRVIPTPPPPLDLGLS